MSYYNSGVPEQRQDCPMPPYNATNFNSENGPVFNTLQSYAQTQQQYPLPAGSNANQIYRNSANVMLFNSINQKTLDIRAKNDALHAQIPYPQFKSEGERLMYRQGLATTAARTQMAGAMVASPFITPSIVQLSTNYQIINS